jgi:hypothetical protein
LLADAFSIYRDNTICKRHAALFGGFRTWYGNSLATPVPLLAVCGHAASVNCKPTARSFTLGWL